MIERFSFLHEGRHIWYQWMSLISFSARTTFGCAEPGTAPTGGENILTECGSDSMESIRAAECTIGQQYCYLYLHKNNEIHVKIRLAVMEKVGLMYFIEKLRNCFFLYVNCCNTCIITTYLFRRITRNLAHSQPAR